MKIGILTFHSQLNYGGVLQCFALQTVLERMSHEVLVIDRWHDAINSSLESGYNQFSARQWAQFCVRSVVGFGDWARLRRVQKTKQFIKRNLHLTPYHFVDWKDAPKDLGVDMLVVGSDQVWHCGDWGNPRAYLLDGAPNIPAIAYAVSFGMARLPEWIKKDEKVDTCLIYTEGMKRFRAISCREAEGVAICNELGFEATHVVDPTLLAWYDGYRVEKQNELVCYFMSESMEEYIEELSKFARQNNCNVKIFLNDPPLLPIPKNMAMLRSNRARKSLRNKPGVEIMSSASPEEFLEAFKTAQYAISDSYHALMFSICYGCNVRILRPKSEFRRTMFARIEEVAKHTKGNLITDSVCNAIASFYNGEQIEFDRKWLTVFCKDSLSWLQKSIAISS